MLRAQVGPLGYRQARNKPVRALRVVSELTFPDPEDADADHFDPPKPPPLPVPRPRTVGGVLSLAVGVLLLAGPNLLGLSERVATPLGLLALTGGIGWLVIGLRSTPLREGSDDGAQL